MQINDVQEAFLRLLNKITEAATATGRIKAVLSLGSSGLETDRIDRFSDLDIWIITEDGHNSTLLANLDWLAAANPIDYSYMHGPTGYTVLFHGGISAEISLITMAEFQSMSSPGARILWKAPGVPDDIALPRTNHIPHKRTLEELIGEALLNLYVGVGRFYRGEKLTAMRFVQVYAVDRIIEMAPYKESEQTFSRDPFVLDRRVERRFPRLAESLPSMTQGYNHTPQSARAALTFLSTHFKLNALIEQAIDNRLAEGRF